MNCPQVIAVRVLHDYWLRLWFKDGMIVDVDVWPLISWGEVFEPLRADRSLFEQVRADGTTIVWPGDLDLSPDVLHGDYEPASGTRFERRVRRAGDPALA